MAALHLPGDAAATPAALEAAGGVKTRPPREMARIIDRLRAYLEGRPQRFDDVSVDLTDTGAFTRAVYAQAQRLPSGEVTTYGALAAAIGRPGGARAVGQALGRNPVPIIIPCHRIVAAAGRPGGFSAPGGLDTKRRLLALEGVALAIATDGRPPSACLWEPGALEAAVAHLRRVDRTLRRVIDQVGPCRLEPHWTSVFEALCVSIIHQQLAGKAAAAITRRFTDLVTSVTPDSVQGVDDAAYRAAGLSSGKVASLRALAEAVVDGRVRLDAVRSMDDDEATRHLVTVRGIGPWTVQMLQIFHLGRPDVLPPGDLGIRKAMQRLAGLDGLPTPAEMSQMAEPWRPWRTVGMWYLWRTLD